MDTDAINLDGFKLAKSRINGKVRETPLLKSQPLKRDLTPQGSLSLKLENLQPTGSFKVRGAINTLHTLTQEQKNKGLITASGGNHGLAVAYAAFLAQVPARIYLPTSTSPEKLEKLQSWGAETCTLGDVWDEANKGALAEARAANMTYIHPFADPNVIYGQGTISLEVLEMNP
jgi:threonine dehydratase